MHQKQPGHYWRLMPSCYQNWLTELRFLRPTRHKTGHFGDVLPSQSLGIVLKKLNLQINCNTQYNHRKLNLTNNKQLLGLFICVCIALCTSVVHNTAQNRPDNFPSYSADNHHCSVVTRRIHTFQKHIITSKNILSLEFHCGFLLLSVLWHCWLGGRKGIRPVKNGGDDGGGHWLVRMEWRPPGLSVCLPLLIFPCTIKSRSFLLAPAHPGGPTYVN